MKRVLFLVCVLLLALVISAQAATNLYWSSRANSGALSLGLMMGNGKWTAWSVSATNDAWQSYLNKSTVRYNTAPHNSIGSAFQNSNGTQGFAEIEFYLPATGYWTMAHTQYAACATLGNIGVTHLSGATGLPSTTDQFKLANVWNVIGTMKATALNPKIRFNENGAVTGTDRWYLDQIRLTSATPVAATGLGNTEMQLNWAPGSYSSSFDVSLTWGSGSQSWLGLAEGTSSVNLPTLLPGTTYNWTVSAKNVDMTTVSSASFTTAAVPEPGTIVAAMALLAPAGMMIRRRRA